MVLIIQRKYKIFLIILLGFLMAKEPTYEELKKRIQQLEQSKSKCKLAKRKLQTEKKELRSILNINPDLMIVLDAEGRYRDIFTGDSSKLILPVNQLLGKSIHKVMPLREAQQIQDIINQTLSTRKFQQKEYVLNIEGVNRWFIGRSIRIIFQNSECVLWLARDITKRKQIEDKLRTSEEKFRVLYNNSPDMYVSVSPDDAGIILCNETLLKKTGYSREDIIGSPIFKMYHDDCMDEVKKTFQQFVETGVVKNRELILKRKNGTKIDVSLNANAVKNNEGRILYSISSWRDITRQKQAADLVKDLSQKLIQAQERERQMISCELHDSIAQDLSTLKLYCSRLLKDQFSTKSGFKSSLADVLRLIDQIITTVRDLAYDLRPPGLEHLGLVHSLEIFCEEFTQKNGITVDFQVAGINESTLNWDAQINLYRLVTEGLNNIRKHAAASKSTIKFVGAHPNIILRIKDNGKGFDVKKRKRSVTKGKRLGLQSMKERVNLLQGQMSIHSQSTKGTEIVIELPLKDK